MKKLILTIMAATLLFSCTKDKTNPIVGTWYADSSYSPQIGKQYHDRVCGIEAVISQKQITDKVCIFGEVQEITYSYALEGDNIITDGGNMKYSLNGTTLKIHDVDSLIIWYSK
jgi:hypothetical protein